MSKPVITNPVYRIETTRLVLRCWQPDDAEMMRTATAESKEHLLPFMPWAADEPQTVEQKVATARKFRGWFDSGEDYVYGIFNQNESRVLGGTGLHTRPKDNALEIGYWLHKDFVNQGLITESTAALTKVAFEVYNVERMEIHCAVQNIASAAIPKKLGYTHEATRRQFGFAYGKPADNMIWTLFAEEYANTPCAAAQLKAFDVLGKQVL